MENCLLDQPMISYWKYSHLILLPTSISGGSRASATGFSSSLSMSVRRRKKRRQEKTPENPAKRIKRQRRHRNLSLQFLRSAISAESLNMQQYCLQTYASTVLCIEWKMVPVMLMYEKAALPMNVTAEHVSRPWSSQPYMPRMSRSYDTWKSTVNA